MAVGCSDKTPFRTGMLTLAAPPWQFLRSIDITKLVIKKERQNFIKNLPLNDNRTS